MFWIVGGEELVRALYNVCPIGPLHLLDTQMGHKAWEGVAFYDLIFPLFVFIVGASLVFSLSKAIATQGRAAAMKRIFVRSLLIYGGISKGVDGIRWLGVLQRIAIAYFFAALIFCAFKPKAIAGVCAALLLGYWGLVAFVPTRDFNVERGHLQAQGLTPGDPRTRELFLSTTKTVTRHFEEGLNLPNHIDFQYLPGRRWDGAYDPEGLLSTLPAIATCLLGVFAGLLLKNEKLNDQRKVVILAGAGLAGVALGFLWGLQFPVIKKLWTSSYVLVAAGYSALFLAAFHQIIEVWGWRKWCTPFVWIGMNPITIYMVVNLVDVGKLAERFAGGPIKSGLGNAGELAVAATWIVMMFAFVRFLYQRKIFLRL
jgi:predicted acyltransferase